MITFDSKRSASVSPSAVMRAVCASWSTVVNGLPLAVTRLSSSLSSIAASVSKPVKIDVTSNWISSELPPPSLKVTVLTPVEVPSNEPEKVPTVIVMAAGAARLPKVSVVEEIAETSPTLSEISIVAGSITPPPPLTVTVSAATTMSVSLSKFSFSTMMAPKSLNVTVSILPVAIAVDDNVAVSVVPSALVNVRTLVALS